MAAILNSKMAEIIADEDIIPTVTPMFSGSRNMIRPLASVHMLSPIFEFKMAANIAGSIQKNHLIIKKTRCLIFLCPDVYNQFVLGAFT